MRDTGVSAEPEQHGRARGVLGRRSGVATEAGNHVGVQRWSVSQFQVVVPTAEETGGRP